MHQLVNASLLRVGSRGKSGKDNVAFVVDAWVAASGMDEFPVPAALLPDEEHGNLAAGFQPRGQFL